LAVLERARLVRSGSATMPPVLTAMLLDWRGTGQLSLHGHRRCANCAACFASSAVVVG
jgi:hypothetical protein